MSVHVPRERCSTLPFVAMFRGSGFIGQARDGRAGVGRPGLEQGAQPPGCRGMEATVLPPALDRKAVRARLPAGSVGLQGEASIGDPGEGISAW